MEPLSGKIMVIILNIFCVGYFFRLHLFLYTLYNVLHSRARSGSYMEKYGDYIKGAPHLISFFILPSPLHCNLIFFFLLIFILCCAEKCAQRHPVYLVPCNAVAFGVASHENYVFTCARHEWGCGHMTLGEILTFQFYSI
jgi:hypothetical protein